MFRAYRIALAAGAPLGRTAVGLAVLLVVLTWVVPPPEPDARPRPQPDGPPAIVRTVTLTVPEGEMAGTLNIVDELGRELATLTYFSDGDTAVVARRRDGAALGLWLPGEGTARMQMTGTMQVTNIEMDPDGTTRTSTVDRRDVIKPPVLQDAGLRRPQIFPRLVRWRPAGTRDRR